MLTNGGLLQVNGVVEGVEVDGLFFLQDRLGTEVETKGVEVICGVRPLNNCEVVEVVVEAGLLSGPFVEEGLTSELVDTLVAPAGEGFNMSQDTSQVKAELQLVLWSSFLPEPYDALHSTLDNEEPGVEVNVDGQVSLTVVSFSRREEVVKVKTVHKRLSVRIHQASSVEHPSTLSVSLNELGSVLNAGTLDHALNLCTVLLSIGEVAPRLAEQELKLVFHLVAQSVDFLLSW